MEFVMGGKQQYLNESHGVVRIEYKPFVEDKTSAIGFDSIFFTGKGILLEVDTDRDSFIIDGGNHIYLEFTRLSERICLKTGKKTNRFQLNGVRPVSSLGTQPVISLEGVLWTLEAGQEVQKSLDAIENDLNQSPEKT